MKILEDLTLFAAFVIATMVLVMLANRPANAHGGPPCYPSEKARKHAEESRGERVLMKGSSSTGPVMLLVNPSTGSYTFLLRPFQQPHLACVLNYGMEFTPGDVRSSVPVPGKKPEPEGDPA